MKNSIKTYFLRNITVAEIVGDGDADELVADADEVVTDAEDVTADADDVVATDDVEAVVAKEDVDSDMDLTNFCLTFSC